MMMPCQQQQQQQSWTISCLISLFIQLIITYLLLSCSALVFFFSKFLSFLGISLPCTCHPLLVDLPSHSLSSIHLSIASRYPFRPFLERNDHTQLSFKLVPDTHSNGGVVDVGLELNGSISGGESSDEFDRKGKGSARGRHRSRVRHRRRGGLDDGKLVSRSDIRTVHHSPSELDAEERCLVPVRSVQDYGGVDSTYEKEFMLENATLLDVRKHRVGHGFDCHDKNAVMILEQALELEQSARAALCAELEQERIAAATAADEAMAMISRLQEEKASVEIEARQYQRILEEKSDYDAEEMTILKEIIVRRETEIHFLEKEVEEYRKRFEENEGLECQVEDTQEYYDIMDSHVDPSLSEKLPATECRDAIIDKGKESPESCSIVHDGDETGQEIQEKGILSADHMLFSQFSKSKNSLEHEVFEENSNPGLMSNDNVVKADKGQVQMQSIEPHVHDVHIVASKFDSSSGVCNSHKVEDSSDYGQRVDHLGVNRSCSDMAERFPSLSSSPSRSLYSEQRQNSLSSVDQERLKIDSEIGCLRARLRAVQKEKEKLKSSLQSQDQSITELRLLEDIAVLLREIRRLREPENVASQASLPPLSSKETSKRRRSRSTSVGVGQSTST